MLILAQHLSDLLERGVAHSFPPLGLFEVLQNLKDARAAFYGSSR